MDKGNCHNCMFRKIKFAKELGLDGEYMQVVETDNDDTLGSIHMKCTLGNTNKLIEFYKTKKDEFEITYLDCYKSKTFDNLLREAVTQSTYLLRKLKHEEESKST